MVINEVYTGAGLTATMIPEMDFELSDLVGATANSVKTISTTSNQTTLTWTVLDTNRLVPNIYKGCVAKLTGYSANNANLLGKTFNLVIKSNTENTIVFNHALSSVAGDRWRCTILSYGAPVLAPSTTSITGNGVTGITIVNDGARILFAASQTLAFSGGGGAGATGTYTLTKHKNALTCTAESGANYDGTKLITIKSVAATPITYVFWFNAGGAGTDPNNSSPIVDIEVVLDNGDAVGTVASTLTAAINTAAGLTATVVGAEVTVEPTNGGYLTSHCVLTGSSHPLTKTELVIGGEVEAVSIGNSGSGYTSAPAIAAVTTAVSAGTNATFSTTFGTVTSPTLLSDNWLGLVNTIAPPSVDVEMKQLNLALGGTRNFNYQYKGAETLGNASIDVSASHGMWLYYALGSMSYTIAAGNLNSSSLSAATPAADSSFGLATGGSNIYRTKGSVIVPTPPAGTVLSNYKQIKGPVEYVFSESDSGDLPSFALEVTAEKGNITYATQDATDDFRKHYSRIYTGLQVNTLTMNFEEGQELKMTIDAMARKAHDAANNYTPKAGVTANTNLFNLKTGTILLTADDTKPYMFSDGSIKVYGQSLGRVKNGSITITNSLTAQRFIGNYDRSITSATTAGQRIYTVTLTLLITDRKMWEELRNENETTTTKSSSGSATSEFGDIELEFEKDSNTQDKLVIKLKDYLTSNVDIPFPDDKGALEVVVTLQPRNLSTCTYTGKWIIQG